MKELPESALFITAVSFGRITLMWRYLLLALQSQNVTYTTKTRSYRHGENLSHSVNEVCPDTSICLLLIFSLIFRVRESFVPRRTTVTSNNCAQSKTRLHARRGDAVQTPGKVTRSSFLGSASWRSLSGGDLLQENKTILLLNQIRQVW